MPTANQTITGGLRSRGNQKQALPGKPLVSIITVVYNGGQYLEQAIQSVLGQSYDNIEYIIIDGASSDNTVDIIKKYDDRINYWISEQDEGIYFAMNKGIQLAKGELIGLLNADDRYEENTVMTVIEHDQKNQADIYHGDLLLVKGEAGQSIIKPEMDNMDRKPGINHPTCFVRKSVYESIGLFDTQYKISSDYEFLLRCLKHGCSFHYIPETLTVFRQGGMSDSCHSNLEAYRILKKYRTGHHRTHLHRAMACFLKKFIKKLLIPLRKSGKAT